MEGTGSMQVFFIMSCDDRSSDITNGYEIARMLCKHRECAISAVYKQLPYVGGSVCVFTKPPIHILRELREQQEEFQDRNIRVVIDCVDALRHYGDEKYCDMLSSLQNIFVIAKTQQIKRRLEQSVSCPVFVVYHNVSDAFRIECENYELPSIGYFGGGKDLPEFAVPFVDANRLENKPLSYSKCPFEEGLKQANVHICVREAPFAPNNKITQAAYSHANVIVSRDAGGAELLPDDYPYFCDYNQESFLKTREKVLSGFGGTEWSYGLEAMRDVLKKTNEDAIVKQYKDMFVRIF